MKVLIVHNEYVWTGGEETAVRNEVTALENRGHTVVTHVVSNKAISGVIAYITSAISNLYNRRQEREIRDLVQRYKPDIVHVHNFFPQISPSVFYACRKEHVPSIHTLHNYRILCPSTTLFHDGELYWHGVNGKYLRVIWDAVYRNSRIATFSVVASILLHRLLGTWAKVDRLIALSDFQKGVFDKTIHAKIEVLPHFSSTSDQVVKSSTTRSNFHVYAGRLGSEKGILQLISDWPDSEQLVILGDGPLATEVERLCTNKENLHWRGHVEREELLRTMREAKSVVVPSVLHETFGLVVIESLSVGTPVLVNNMEPFRDLIVPGKTGELFNVGSKSSLHSALQKIAHLDDATRQRCLDQYEQQYSEQIGVQKLETLMKTVIAEKHSSSTSKIPFAS